MKLDINKRFIKAGEVLEVTWDAEDGQNPRLILYTSNRESSLAVPSNGTKRFRIKNSKGKHRVGLTIDLYGKEQRMTKHVFVYGKAKETDEFEYIDRGDASPLSRSIEKMKTWWGSYTSEKKHYYILLLYLLAMHSCSHIPSISAFSDIFFYILIFWLFWQVVKK